jgi:(4-O-methyl)-D-glucuronate---lignin esterase
MSPVSQSITGFALLVAGFTFLSSDGVVRAQTPAAPAADTANAAPLNWTTQQDHQNMMDQLGIQALRPGPSGRAGSPNSANYDPAKANPFPDLPDALTLKYGEKVTTAEMWWKQRRPEIVEDFEREIVGRVPKEVPKVTWTVTETVTNGLVGELPANGKQLIGHVDNSACPAITVNIRMTLVTPAKAKGPVPVLMMFGGFGGGGMPRAADAPSPANPPREFGGPYKDPPSREQLLAAGWGYATTNPGSIQADNGAGLTKGIIGLVNKGQPRKPDDWGSLRAWAWGAARGLDYLESDSAVDAKKVGIEGVSRFGKAALVTLAFEPRFAVALVGSSGEGGAKLHRRNFGEAVENLTASGEYHWMAGNFLKYGAAEAKFGSKNAGDLPVDAHQLIALCAPRPTFISYGVPERGDALWLDQQGSYMAAIAAGPVFRLLGARDLGEKEDYRTAKMPPVNTGLLDGELAWRQHDGGHEDRSNMKHFIAWASKQLKYTPSAAAEAPETK